MAETTIAKAWNYAIGLIRIDGLEPTEDFKKYKAKGENDA